MVWLRGALRSGGRALTQLERQGARELEQALRHETHLPGGRLPQPPKEPVHVPKEPVHVPKEPVHAPVVPKEALQPVRMPRDMFQPIRMPEEEQTPMRESSCRRRTYQT